jgi:hypothetical protein
MPWWIEKEDEAIIKEIESSRDRAAAITAAAYLEQRLADVFKAMMEDDEGLQARIFKGYGPFSSFSAKIDLGYLFGFYPDKMRRVLQTVKDIRNEFAHNPKSSSFKTQRIKDLSNNLPKRSPRKGKPLNLLKSEVEELIANKQRDVAYDAFIIAVWVGPDTPRQRFIATVKYFLFAFHQSRKMILLEKEIDEANHTLGKRHLGWRHYRVEKPSPEKSRVLPLPVPQSGDRGDGKPKRPT